MVMGRVTMVRGRGRVTVMVIHNIENIGKKMHYERSQGIFQAKNYLILNRLKYKRTRNMLILIMLGVALVAICALIISGR
jgi:hypothetical protein